MQSRRKFLHSGLLATAAASTPTALMAKTEDLSLENKNVGAAKNGTITFLQTTDVHCQLHAHDELFWEKNKLTFRKTGGYAHMATALDILKKEYQKKQNNN